MSDPALMRLVLEEMPPWVSDPSFQRVEWINPLLMKLWPMIVQAIGCQYAHLFVESKAGAL